MMALLPFSINSPVVLNLRHVGLHRVTRTEWSWLPADKSDTPKIQFLQLHIVTIATTTSKWLKLFTEEACRSTALLKLLHVSLKLSGSEVNNSSLVTNH